MVNEDFLTTFIASENEHSLPIEIPFTENDGQEFVVSYVLHFSDDNASCFLVKFLVVPRWIEESELIGNSVVFPKEKYVHKSKPGILIDSGIAAEEARQRFALGSTTSGIGRWHRQILSLCVQTTSFA